jgi:hypothetical protein
MIPQRATEDRVHIRDDAARFHFDKDVAVARLRPSNLVNAQRLSRLVQTGGSHACNHFFTPWEATSSLCLQRTTSGQWLLCAPIAGPLRWRLPRSMIRHCTSTIGSACFSFLFIGKVSLLAAVVASLAGRGVLNIRSLGRKPCQVKVLLCHKSFLTSEV